MENSPIMPNIRIRKITLTDFRNIKYSEVDIPNGKMEEYLAEIPSILGLYGQNGSGKTSLLMAIGALKNALSGSEFLFPAFSSCVRSGCDHARLEFEFSAYNEKGTHFDIYYGFSLSNYEGDKTNEEPVAGDDDELSKALGSILSGNLKSRTMDLLRPKDRRIIISDELLQCGGESKSGKKQNKQIVIDTSEKACAISAKAFGNKTKYKQLTENCSEEIHENLIKWKIEANIKSKSFIFSEKVVNNLIRGSSVISYKLVLAAMSEYAKNYVFVIGTDEAAYNSIKAFLPFSIWLNGENGAVGLTLPLLLGDHCQVQDEIFEMVLYAIKMTSNIIAKIVPNLIIEVMDIGKTVSDNGREVHLFDLVSNRNGIRIPLSYESDGIRRIISFLTLMIAVYNNPSVTVAIDEIDSGIFEYMLGELLTVLGDSAKGQLIFTSHNLRPLEVLPPKYLLFTTVNPERRFAKLEGISGNNNLRDCYFRTIDLGVGKDAFYDATDTFSIEQALFEAGQLEDTQSE